MVGRPIPKAVRAGGLFLAAVSALGGVALALAAWPVTVLLAVGITTVLLLAASRPAEAFLIAVGLFSFEGSIKMLLTGEGVPLEVRPEAVGAAALDLALFGAIAGVLWQDRLATPRLLWGRAGRLERVAIIALGAWLALSVVQIFIGGHIARGLGGLRVAQAYVGCLVAGAIVLRPRSRYHSASALVGVIAVATVYAALRVLIGPADNEIAFASSKLTVSNVGTHFRAVGSFSSAVGLESFLTPVATFAFVAGWLVPRVRVMGWGVAALAVVGLIGSYGRTPLVALTLGVAVAGMIVLTARSSPRRLRLAAIGSVGGVLAVVGTVVALAVTGASPALQDRARGLIDPAGDASVHTRLGTWKNALEGVEAHLWGQGLGAVGRASGGGSHPGVTTDNTYLKVLVEQGPLGILVFLIGVVGLTVAAGRRLRHLGPAEHPVALAGCAAFVSFLTLWVTTDDIEQPGKVVAWAMLGAALVAGMEGVGQPEGAG